MGARQTGQTSSGALLFENRHFSQVKSRRKSLKNGQYSIGVWLRDIDAVKQYLELQEPYQNHIQICDWNDLTVLQVEHGCYVFRDAQMEAKMRQTQSFCGGMMMS